MLLFFFVTSGSRQQRGRLCARVVDCATTRRARSLFYTLGALTLIEARALSVLYLGCANSDWSLERAFCGHWSSVWRAVCVTHETGFADRGARLSRSTRWCGYSRFSVAAAAGRSPIRADAAVHAARVAHSTGEDTRQCASRTTVSIVFP